jgi:arylsulfatase A-like enzyme
MKISRIYLSLFCCFWIFVPVLLPAAERPNVLFIAVDDLNEYIGPLQPQVRTPNIDRLAGRGICFSNAHCQSPICNPSRTSLLTGLRPSTTGVYALEPWFRTSETWANVTTLPQYFAQNGYYTVATGKIFHDYGQFATAASDRPEFDLIGYVGGFGPLPPKKFVNTPDPMRLIDWGPYPEKDEEGEDYKVASWAITQLKELPKDKPFFMCVGFYRPHLPLFAPQKWHDLYPEESLVLPPYLENDRDDVPPFAWYLHWKLPEVGMKWVKAHNQWKAIFRSYLASVSYMDAQLGRLLDALETEGLAENTVIVLWGDNGWHLGQKELFSKTSLWDPATKVPLIISGKGVTGRGLCSQPAELLDIYPTLIEVCGLPKNESLEGISLSPQLADAKTLRERPAITTHGPDNHSIRTARFRYTLYGDGSKEFYDMQDDPNEWTNRIADPQYQKEIEKMEKWIPKNPAAPLPGSRNRLIEKKNGVWHWEGIPIHPNDQVPALGTP